METTVMTDRQMEFLVWLITTAMDKCKDMDEVRKLNEEIRNHSAGIKSDEAHEDK